MQAPLCALSDGPLPDVEPWNQATVRLFFNLELEDIQVERVGEWPQARRLRRDREARSGPPGALGKGVRDGAQPPICPAGPCHLFHSQLDSPARGPDPAGVLGPPAMSGLDIGPMVGPDFSSGQSSVSVACGLPTLPQVRDGIHTGPLLGHGLDHVQEEGPLGLVLATVLESPLYLLAEAGLVLHTALTVDMQDGGCNGRSQVKAKPQLVHDGLGHGRDDELPASPANH